MSRWTPWIEMTNKKRISSRLDFNGVYEIRVVDREGVACAIPRVLGSDDKGILYIGRSGYRSSKSKRTVAKRADEFDGGAHSGGQTFSKIWSIAKGLPKWQGRTIQIRAKEVDDDQIDEFERKRIRTYMMTFGEVPPCNSAGSRF